MSKFDEQPPSEPRGIRKLLADRQFLIYKEHNKLLQEITPKEIKSKKKVIFVFIACVLAVCLFLYKIEAITDAIVYVLPKSITKTITDAVANVVVTLIMMGEPTPASVTDYFEPIKCDYCWDGVRSENERKLKFKIEESDDKNTVDFELYETISRQGFYEYYVWINAIDAGTVYLKAAKMGATRDTPLYRIEIYTAMEVHNQSNGFVKYGPKLFSIHEDFYVKSYFARFELWHKPKNKGKGRKLATKIYKVKGFID